MWAERLRKYIRKQWKRWPWSHQNRDYDWCGYPDNVKICHYNTWVWCRRMTKLLSYRSRRYLTTLQSSFNLHSIRSIVVPPNKRDLRIRVRTSVPSSLYVSMNVCFWCIISSTMINKMVYFHMNTDSYITTTGSANALTLETIKEDYFSYLFCPLFYLRSSILFELSPFSILTRSTAIFACRSGIFNCLIQRFLLIHCKKKNKSSQ